MKVSEFADDLELPASVVLEQCTRLGLDASWAGAELSATDMVVLRAELAADDVATVSVGAHAPAATGASTGPAGPAVPADPAPATPPDEASAVPTDSPAAVGSMPELAEELASPAPPTLGGARLPGGIGGGSAAVATPDAPRAPVGHKSRRFDPSLRPALAGLVVAGLAFAGSNAIGHPVLIGILWVVAAVALVVSLLGGNRARYHITNHPDQRKGLVIALVAMVATVAATIGLGTAVWAAVRTAPPADAPLGIGEMSSVQNLRWSYQRVRLVQENGWHRPAKDVGTCWEADGKPRDVEDRVEVGGRAADCDDAHGYEVIGLYSVDRDADSPYPGVAALTAYALERCESAQAKLDTRPAGLSFEVEYPTEAGWDAADHDVTCVAAALSDRSLR